MDARSPGTDAHRSQDSQDADEPLPAPRAAPAEAAAQAAPAQAPAEAAALGSRAELSEFLRTRRARLQPEDVGLPASAGRHRRVPGLRREELALLAGVSVAYYTRLEQGHGRNVSAEVLDAIARALRLTEAEQAHLHHLAKPTRSYRKRTARPQRMRPALGGLLESMDGFPAYVIGSRTQLLGWNRMSAALFGDWAELPVEERNWARLIFLHSQMRELFADWEGKAADIVSSLRMEAGRHQDDPQLSALVGELSVKSEDFRRLWAQHDVKEKSHGEKRLSHPLVGELTLFCESFLLSYDEGQCLVTYHAEPGSPSAESLRLLASWGTDAARARRA